LLFFDPRLSADNTVSCATCHNPKHGFTDGAPVSTGIRHARDFTARATATSITLSILFLDR
jgi:cytochrome c peroxidase